MKLKNMVTAFLTAVTIASFGTISAFAEEGNFIQGTVQGTNEEISYGTSEYVDIYTESLSRGTTLPSHSKVYDLSEHYIYDSSIENFRYSIYTNYWFTGASDMTLSLYGQDIYTYLTVTNPNIERKITVELYEMNNFNNPIASTSVSSWDEYVYSGYYFKFDNLNSSKKYAFRIVKTNDGTQLYDIDLSVY